MIYENTKKGTLCFQKGLWPKDVISFEKIVDSRLFSGFSVYSIPLEYGNNYKPHLNREFFYTEEDVKNKNNVSKEAIILYQQYLTETQWQQESL